MKILWKEQFLLFSTIFCFLLLDFNVKTGTRFSLRDKRLFKISEVEIMRVHCISCKLNIFAKSRLLVNDQLVLHNLLSTMKFLPIPKTTTPAAMPYFRIFRTYTIYKVN